MKFKYITLLMFLALCCQEQIQAQTTNFELGCESLENWVTDSSGDPNNVGLNTGVGYEAGQNLDATDNTTIWNTIVGFNAMKETVTDANYNVAIGASSLLNCESNHNVAVGGYALSGDNFSGGNNTALGFYAGSSLGGNSSNNLVVGNDAFMNQTVGSNNTIIGFYAAENVAESERSGNTIIGYRALIDSDIGNANVFVGAGTTNTGAINDNNRNTVIGYNGEATGSNGVAFGYGAETCQGAVALGANTTVSGENSIAIGKDVVITQKNTAKLGSENIQNLKMAVTPTTTSDLQLMGEVKENTLGLDFVLGIQPQFYETEKEGEKCIEAHLAGQEMEQVLSRADASFSGLKVAENETYTLQYDALVMPLVNAIQEQQVQMENNQQKLEAALAKRATLLEQLSALEMQVEN